MALETSPNNLLGGRNENIVVAADKELDRLPIPGRPHHGQDGAKRPVPEDNLLLPAITEVAGSEAQQTPLHSPYVSSVPDLPNPSPSTSLHPIASADIESRAREIDRNMLGRLDGKNSNVSSCISLPFCI